MVPWSQISSQLIIIDIIFFSLTVLTFYEMCCSSTMPGWARILGCVFMRRQLHHINKSNEYFTNMDMKESKVIL